MVDNAVCKYDFQACVRNPVSELIIVGEIIGHARQAANTFQDISMKRHGGTHREMDSLFYLSGK